MFDRGRKNHCARRARMKILHYYWVDPEDPAARGGGVRVYLQALVTAQRERPGWQVTTLASALAHDLRSRPPRWRECRPGHYEIVNSASLAPSHADFATPAQVADPATESAFSDFLERTGPYDVIHFHSLEGIPAQCLSLTSGARCVLSLHNYHPFCPQVNLWHQESAHCADFDGGKACAQCLPVPPNPAAMRLVYRVETGLTRLGMGPGRAVYQRLWRPLMQGAWRLRKRLRGRSTVPGPRAQPVGPPITRRSAMVGLINAHCDTVLAVSERTRQIALRFGLRDVTTCYIGTADAAHWMKTAPRIPPARISPFQPLRLIYLGYMRADKGFDFLLDALHALPPELAGCLHLTVAARRGEAQMMVRLKTLEGHLAGLEWQDGYQRDQLDGVLLGVHFGIVPPLWEDNLPQVALEMHARHIPLVTSDRGGAQELGGSPALWFRAGDRQDFGRLIARLVAGEIRMDEYWTRARVPRSIAQHAQDLAQIYGSPK
ncbi:MAG: glycosyltransferase [Rhodobacteraceae bacterium]|nr:MAG: glycosyltransferase [Paracoccaceae bacterium]